MDLSLWGLFLIQSCDHLIIPLCLSLLLFPCSCIWVSCCRLSSSSPAASPTSRKPRALRSWSPSRTWSLRYRTADRFNVMLFLFGKKPSIRFFFSSAASVSDPWGRENADQCWAGGGRRPGGGEGRRQNPRWPPHHLLPWLQGEPLTHTHRM